jgi:Cft2 family RNA processing exonuclease
MMARRVSGRATVAVEASTRKFVQRPNSRPPPKAVLPMAEMVGIGSVDRRVKVLLSLVKNWATLFVSYQYA